jgi:hypothetical protein
LLPDDVLAHVAVQTVLAVVRDTTDPLALFARHHNGAAEYGPVSSIAGERSCTDLLNLIDSGYLLRWQEVTTDGHGPEELPPFNPREWTSATFSLADGRSSRRPMARSACWPGPGSGKTTGATRFPETMFSTAMLNLWGMGS